MTLITLPLPGKCLSPNSRCSWRTKSRAVRRYREASYLAALDAKNRAGETGGWPSAEMTCRFFHRDNRRRDPDNLLASMKPAIDGLVDAGILTDDVGVIHRPVETTTDRKDPRVEITIRQI